MTTTRPTPTASIPHAGNRWSRDLTRDWSVSVSGGPVPSNVESAMPIPAAVPGTIHTDLLAAGLIPDPYQDTNELALGWIGQCDWTWRTTLSTPAEIGDCERIDLVIDGIDTVASVILDGREVLTCADQHRSFRIDVTPIMCSHRPGDTLELVVEVASPVRYADAQSLELGYRPQVNAHPYPAIRKMACSFGWDWGPDLATSGIWRPVRLEGWSRARIDALRITTDITSGLPVNPGAPVDALVTIDVDLERTGPHAGPLTVTARVGDVLAAARVDADADRATLTLPLAGVRPWWPVGYGDPALHDLHVDVDEGGTVLDSAERRIGIRTVALDTDVDELGHGFTLLVNGVPVFVRGANWIPDDAFPHRVDADRYERRVRQALGAGVNLLRVWGGGIFEEDTFYDLCDQLGVMVWQDFLFACAAYAEEEPLASEVAAEVRDNVSRLAHHASLVLWNGSNENYVGIEEWGWLGRLDGRTWGSGYYEGVIPSLLGDLDPTRPYTPTSPWSVGEGIPTKDPDNGSMHLWETWNRQDWVHYRDTVPRFAAEWGWQAPGRLATLREALHDDPLTPESPGMLTHQKAISGNDKLSDGLVTHLRMPDRFEDWHWAMTLNQAWAVTAGVTHHRSWAPRCAGSILWQLNDMWPVTSWSVIDGAGRLKPAYYALKHAFADRLVTIQPREGGLAVAVVNDTWEPWQGILDVVRMTFEGAERSREALPVAVDARSVVVVQVPSTCTEGVDAAHEVLVATLDGVRDLWYFAEARDSDLPTAALDASLRGAEGGFDLTVTARTFVRDLVVLLDDVDPDAEVEDMLLTLLPGESATLRIRTGRDLRALDLNAPGVLRSTNELVVGR